MHEKEIKRFYMFGHARIITARMSVSPYPHLAIMRPIKQ